MLSYFNFHYLMRYCWLFPLFIIVNSWYFIINMVPAHILVQYLITICVSDTYWVSLQCFLCLFFYCIHFWNICIIFYNCTIKTRMHYCACRINHNMMMLFLLPIPILFRYNFTNICFLDIKLSRFTQLIVNRFSFCNVNVNNTY